jgi:hypothetical protein
VVFRVISAFSTKENEWVSGEFSAEFPEEGEKGRPERSLCIKYGPANSGALTPGEIGVWYDAVAGVVLMLVSVWSDAYVKCVGKHSLWDMIPLSILKGVFHEVWIYDIGTINFRKLWRAFPMCLRNSIVGLCTCVLHFETFELNYVEWRDSKDLLNINLNMLWDRVGCATLLYYGALQATNYVVDLTLIAKSISVAFRCLLCLQLYSMR